MAKRLLQAKHFAFSVGRYTACCGARIVYNLSAMRWDYGADYIVGKGFPQIRWPKKLPKYFVDDLKKRFDRTNMVLHAITSADQDKEADILRAAGWKVTQKFKGRHGTTLTSWIYVPTGKKVRQR